MDCTDSRAYRWAHKHEEGFVPSADGETLRRSSSALQTGKCNTSSVRGWVAFCAMCLVLLVQGGCGSGGYPGAGIASLTASVITIDAGQQIGVGANGSGNLPLTWALSGNSCTGSGCGTLSSNSGNSITYMAPASVATPFQVTLSATVAGTQNARKVAINVNPAPVLSGTPPAGMVGTPYSFTFVTSGGTAPLKLSQQSGNLPAGLTFNAATGTISGTPTAAGTSQFVLQLVDSSDVPYIVTAPETIMINAVGTGARLSISGNPQNGTVGTPYSTTLQAAGGVGPYTFSIASGTLPAGLTLNAATGVISGTPSASGSAAFTAQVRDATGNTASGPFNIAIAGPSAISVAGPLPSGTVGTTYNANVGATGGTAPYTCALAGGALPAGLTLNANCSVTGTPTISGTTSVNVQVTDASNPAQTKTAPETITINPAPGLTLSSPPAATVNVPYTGNVPVAGGAAPYTCTLAGGTLPAGLTLNANCTITGTPTTAGAPTISVQATDSSNPARTTTGNVTVTVNPNTGTLTPGNPPVATVNVPYTGTLPISGGVGPYSCTASGTLPAGLTLGANCTITGTPTAAGSSTVQVSATDSGSTATGTGPVTVTVQPVQAVTLTGSLPNGVVGQTYTQTLQASGGIGPYTYAVTAGNLPAGINLSTTGVISGTPTTPGASSFTVTATDSEGTPKSASLPLVLLITYAPTANDNLLNGPYAFLFQGYDDVAVGVLAYQTATAGSITADGKGAITAGEEDSNHQGSNPTGNTIPTRNVLGTYTVGTDRRGLLTLTTFDTNGNAVATNTYAIALRAAVAPATNAAAGDLIEFDNDQVTGTKGSGTLLAQTPSAFTTGLAGSYAYGVKGDTPCLPSCTIGIAAGPVATVGQFAATGGTITGFSDTNIASSNTPNSAVSGSYTAADSNGRVQLNLQSASLAGVPFPTDYAAYVVDANRVILLSTDKHSAYILQAGTAQLQTQATFSNSSLGAAYVGYENSPVNPGLLNTTLQNVLNLTTATIFRGAGNASGSCNTTNVDSSGTTGVVNSLGGLVSAPLVQAALGSYQSLGSAGCTVSANGRAVLNYPAPTAALQIQLNVFGLPTNPAPRVVVPHRA